MRAYVLMMFLICVPELALADEFDAVAADARVYENRCSVCHSLPDPARLDWPAWRGILYVMEKRMDERDIEKPNRDEWQAIARYLKSHAR